MKRPATNSGRARAASTSRARAPRGEIKVTRNSARPQIKASRGPGGPVRQRKVAESRAADRRVAETRRQSLSSLSGASSSGRPRSSRAVSAPSGGGAVRAVAVGAGAGAATAARVVTKPVETVARPMLRVVSGGLELLPQAANRATPIARGRMLIMLVGVLAAGLIYVNVGKLEYGDGYGKYADRSLQLQRENTRLRAQIAHDSSAERIQRYAERQGLVVPAPEQYTYLRDKRGDALRASRGYKAPQSGVTPLSPGPSAVTAGVEAGATVATGETSY